MIVPTIALPDPGLRRVLGVQATSEEVPRSVGPAPASCVRIRSTIRTSSTSSVSAERSPTTCPRRACSGRRNPALGDALGVRPRGGAADRGRRRERHQYSSRTRRDEEVADDVEQERHEEQEQSDEVQALEGEVVAGDLVAAEAERRHRRGHRLPRMERIAAARAHRRLLRPRWRPPSSRRSLARCRG